VVRNGCAKATLSRRIACVRVSTPGASAKGLMAAGRRTKENILTESQRDNTRRGVGIARR
jgi:hypothetical protein